jgi:hypothetical protein
MRQTIKRILREETEIPLFVRRRFTLEDLERLVNEVKEMIDDGDSLDTAIYDGIREFIKSKNFSDIDEFGLDADYWSTYLDYERPLVRYVKSELNIRESVLREETRPLKIMRRTHLIDNEINRLLDRVYYDKRICGRYDDANMFMNVVQEAVLENLYFSTLHNMMDDTSEEWESSANFIYDFIKDSYGEKLKDYFNNMCNERAEIDESKSPKSKKVKCSKCGWSWKLSQGGHDPYTCHKCGNVNSKSELTEKCWAGYTQKGMKTMFGKRYPNCVKKKKK